MEIDIHLENPYFPWTKTEGNNLKCWLKGDLLYKDTLLEGPGIISLFSSLPSSSGMNHDALKDLLVDFKGCFALVIETREGLLCVVDRIRSIPLFYAKIDTRFIISDDANYIRDQINPLFNKNNGAEFLVTGYVTGPETLFDEIYQIRGGQYLSYSGTDCHITTSFYHRFWHEDFFPDSEEELMKCLDEVFVHVFQRLIASTKGKGLQIIVPLSGGLDSRIIIAMLKRLGVDDVICFSYGKKEITRRKSVKKWQKHWDINGILLNILMTSGFNAAIQKRCQHMNDMLVILPLCHMFRISWLYRNYKKKARYPKNRFLYLDIVEI